MEALMLIDTNVSNLMVVIIIKNNVIHPKTFIQVCREIEIHKILLNESLNIDVDTLLLF